MISLTIGNTVIRTADYYGQPLARTGFVVWFATSILALLPLDSGR